MAASLDLVTNPVGNAAQVPLLRKDQNQRIPDLLLGVLYQRVRELIDRFNGQISLGQGYHGERAGNVDAQYIDVQTPVAAHEEFEVPHGLGRSPVGCVIAYCEKPVVIYASGTQWTTTSLFLKCSESFLSGDANAVVKLLVW